MAVTALRGSLNFRGDFVMASVPVTDLAAVPESGPVVIPHIPLNLSWRTQLILLNPTEERLNGMIEFYDSTGLPRMMPVNRQSTSSLPYSIPPGAAQHIEFPAIISTSGGAVSAHVLPAMGSQSPATGIVYLAESDGALVSEAGAAIAHLRKHGYHQLSGENAPSNAALHRQHPGEGAAVFPTALSQQLVGGHGSNRYPEDIDVARHLHATRDEPGEE